MSENMNLCVTNIKPIWVKEGYYMMCLRQPGGCQELGPAMGMSAAAASQGCMARHLAAGSAHRATVHRSRRPESSTNDVQIPTSCFDSALQECSPGSPWTPQYRRNSKKLMFLENWGINYKLEIRKSDTRKAHETNKYINWKMELGQ